MNSTQSTYVRRSEHHPTWHVRRGDGSILCDQTADATRWWVRGERPARICARCAAAERGAA